MKVQVPLFNFKDAISMQASMQPGTETLVLPQYQGLSTCLTGKLLSLICSLQTAQPANEDRTPRIQNLYRRLFYTVVHACVQVCTRLAARCPRQSPRDILPNPNPISSKHQYPYMSGLWGAQARTAGLPSRSVHSTSARRHSTPLILYHAPLGFSPPSALACTRNSMPH